MPNELPGRSSRTQTADDADGGFGLFGMGLAQRLWLALPVTTLLAAATWWALTG